MEIWKYISGTKKQYKISSLGNILSFKYDKKKGRTIKTRVGKTGYIVVSLYVNSKVYTFKVHRLLAIAFIPNPEGKCCVNHKDGIKLNISLDNLEWSTYSENNQHAYDTGLKVGALTGITGANHHGSKPINKLNKKGEFISTYVNAREAGKDNNISYKNISACIYGKEKTAGGFKWEFSK